MIGTMLGVLLLRVLIAGLTHLDVVIYDQFMIRAGIFLAVLWIDATFRQQRRRRFLTGG
jgi:ribose/xylose/arabinose/galactoside ABC-type transport system permease subunit